MFLGFAKTLLQITYKVGGAIELVKGFGKFENFLKRTEVVFVLSAAAKVSGALLLATCATLK